MTRTSAAPTRQVSVTLALPPASIRGPMLRPLGEQDNGPIVTRRAGRTGLFFVTSGLAVDDEAVDRAQYAPGSSRDVRQPD
jgi:hypothetical protein